MQPIIKVNQLRKTFKDKTAIQGIQFEVQTGEVFGLLGPSGAGKTTMIKLLTGELNKTAGDIEVLGRQPNEFQRTAFKSKIGILSDNSALYERLTVYDNLKLFCKLYNVPVSRIDEILEQINMKNESRKAVEKLSKGMKQRILLAKALIHQPELIFLDEPTSALDPGNVAQIHRLLQTLNEAGTTIFLNTHDMEEATVLCHRVAFLHHGQIQELDTPENLRYQYSTHAFHIETLSGKQLIIDNDQGCADEIARLIKQGDVKSIHTDDPSLGQIFLKITGKELV